MHPYILCAGENQRTYLVPFKTLLTNLLKSNQNVRYTGGWLIDFFSGVRQLNRVFSLRHLTIECGKEHRTFDCKNKLLDWDHFFTLTFSRRHWNDKFHIAR